MIWQWKTGSNLFHIMFFFFKEPFLVKPIPTEIQPIPDRIYKPKKKYTFHSRNTVCKFIFLIIDILVETAKKN